MPDQSTSFLSQLSAKVQSLSRRQALLLGAVWVLLLLICSAPLHPAVRTGLQNSSPIVRLRSKRLEVQGADAPGSAAAAAQGLAALDRRAHAASGGQGSSQRKRKYTRDDIIVAIPADVSRLPLVASTRIWRQGIRTFIAVDQPVTPELIEAQPIMKEGIELHRETYGFIENSGNDMHHKAGDKRATLTPFLANATMGLDTFRWVLFGDDDTWWAIENVLNFLDTQDHTVPYVMSDHIWYPWWPDADAERHLHANRLAPRCLPCSYDDPLAGQYKPFPGQFDSQPACFCDHFALCKADRHGLFDHGDCHWTSYGPGFWYFAHGGAGMIMSWDLFRGNTLEGVTRWVNGRWEVSSGDSMIAALIRDNFWVLPTDPGYGYYRPHIRLFDPGWKGEQSKGPEDSTVLALDNGNDPLGVIYRLQTAIIEDGCHAECEDQLQHIFTSHMRTRHMTQEVDMEEIALAMGPPPDDGSSDHRIAAFLHQKLTRLMDEYDAMRPDRTWFNELSQEPHSSFA